MPVLRFGEKVVLTEAGKYAGKDGTLTLTTHRLVFESQSGLLSRKTYTNLDVPRDGIASATVEGLLSKKLYVSLKPGFAPPRCEFSVNDPNKWQQYLSRTVLEVEKNSGVQIGAAPPTYVSIPVGGITITAPVPVAPQPPPPPGPPCPRCNQPLAYIEQYKRWYCYSCKRYA